MQLASVPKLLTCSQDADTNVVRTSSVAAFLPLTLPFNQCVSVCIIGVTARSGASAIKCWQPAANPFAC